MEVGGHAGSAEGVAQCEVLEAGLEADWARLVFV
jgi:hypothetical protein